MSDVLRPPAAQALETWAQRVRANRQQVDQHKEADAGRDFYAPVAGLFRSDPRRLDDPVLDVLRALVQPGESVLDIGAGGGRYALPLADVAREVIALDPSDGMLSVLSEGVAEYGIGNVRAIQGRWPEVADDLRADVALIAHLGYDVEDIGPFLDAMERAARRLCVAVMLEGPPPTAADRLWPAIHGVERASLPALPEFLSLLLARGRLFETRLVARTPMTYSQPEQALAWARQQLWTRPGSDKDARLQRLVHERMLPDGDGYVLSGQPLTAGVVTWQGGMSRAASQA
jgi:SAM-dependent methyltransferase